MKTHQASKTHPLFLSLLGALVFGLISTALYGVRIPLVGTPVPVIIQPLSSFIASSVLGPWYGLLSQFVMLAVLPYTFWAPFGGIAASFGVRQADIFGVCLCRNNRCIRRTSIIL